MKRHIRAGLVSGMLLAGSIAQAAVQIGESEPNDPIERAQKIDISGGSITISPAVLSSGADRDYYEFCGLAGDLVTFDVDGGWGGSSTVDVDTKLFVYGPAADGLPLIDEDDDGIPIDEGDGFDPLIENFRLAKSACYVVGVIPATAGQGDYKLVITKKMLQQEPIQQINIEIKPGSDGLARLNPKAHGKIPVALLSSTGFDAMNVNTESLTFGRTGNEMSLSHCSRNGEDVNGDGRLDLVCHFENQKAGFVKGDLVGFVRGKMTWGTSFEGRGRLKVVPEKRGS